MIEETEPKQDRPRPQLTPEQQVSRQAAMRIADALGRACGQPTGTGWTGGAGARHRAGTGDL